MGRTGIYCGLANHCASAYRPVEAGLAKKLPRTAVCAAGSNLWGSGSPNKFRLLTCNSKVGTARLKGLFVPCNANGTLWSDTNPGTSFVVLPAGSLVWGNVDVEIMPELAESATPKQAYIGYSDEFGAPLFAAEVNGEPCVYVGTASQHGHPLAQEGSNETYDVDVSVLQANDESAKSIHSAETFVQFLPPTRTAAEKLLQQHIVPGKIYRGVRHVPAAATSIISKLFSVVAPMYNTKATTEANSFFKEQRGVLVCLGSEHSCFVSADSAAVLDTDMHELIARETQHQNHWGRFLRWEDERWQLAAHPGDSITWLKAPLLHYNTNGKVQYEHASLHNGISNSANSNGAEWTFEKLKNPTDTATIFATKGTGAHARLHTPTGRIAVVQHLPQWCIDLFQDTVSDSSANWFHTTSTDDNSNTAIIVAELENAPNTPQATVAAVLAKTPPFMATFVTVPVDGEGTKLYQHIGGSKADDNECVVFFSGKDGLKPEQDESGGLTKLRYAFDATEEQKKQFSETLLSDFDPTWWKPTLPIELDIAGKEASAQDLYSGACDYKAGLAGIVYARSMAWSKSRADASELSPDTIHPNPHLADAILPLSMTPAVVARHVYGAARVAAVQKTLATTENDINFASDLAVDALLTSCVSVEQDYTDANRKLQSTGRALLRALNNNTDPRTPDALAAMVQYAYSKHAVLAIAAAHQRLFTRDAAIDLAVARAAEHYKVYTTFIPLVETGVPEAAFSVLELKPDTTFTASQFSSQVAEYSNADYQEAKTANICTKYSSDEWETGRGKMKHTITDSSIQGVFCGIMQYAVRVSDTKEITLYRGSDNDFELLEKESDEERRSELHALVTLARCDQRLQKNCASNTQLECGELTMHRTSGVVTSSDGKLSHVINAPEADGSLLIQATYEDSPSFKMCVAVPFIITPARDHLDIAVIAAIAKQYPKHRLKSARSSSGLPLEMEAFTKDRDIYIKTGDSDNPWKYNNIYDSELLLAVN